jgi:5,10-methylenetetrahydromethanopterin reductase
VSDVGIRPARGIWLYPAAGADALVEAVRAADAAGLDEVWVADEGVARDPWVVLAAAARETSRVRLGVGITTPMLRHPGSLGSAAATLDELSGGRAVLGLGVGGTESLGPFGLHADKPVALVRDAIRTARAVVERRRDAGYEPPVHGAPARQVPIHVGAKGEQLNRLASREADGVFLSGFALDALDAPVAWARSVRPVHVGLFASVRFRSDARADPTSLIGAPDSVGAGLAALVQRHRPETIGLALVDGDDPVLMVQRAIEAFAALDAVLGFSSPG